MAAVLVLVTDLPHRIGFWSATCLLSFIARTGTTGSRGNQSMGHHVSQAVADYPPPPQRGLLTTPEDPRLVPQAASGGNQE